MKTCLKDLFLLLVLIAAPSLIPAGRVTAQTFTTLRSFIGSDGALPFAGLILSGNTLYGTTRWYGGFGGGTVFAVNTDGRGYATLHSFGSVGGQRPNADLILSGNTLYGTTEAGGTPGAGTVFKV